MIWDEETNEQWKKIVLTKSKFGADSPDIADRVIKSHGGNKMKSYDRISRNPDKINVSHTISMTDDQHETIKRAAKLLKLHIGEAMALLAQKCLDELVAGN